MCVSARPCMRAWVCVSMRVPMPRCIWCVCPVRFGSMHARGILIARGGARVVFFMLTRYRFSCLYGCSQMYDWGLVGCGV
jgi:hypothetical protein